MPLSFQIYKVRSWSIINGHKSPNNIFKLFLLWYVLHSKVQNLSLCILSSFTPLFFLLHFNLLILFLFFHLQVRGHKFPALVFFFLFFCLVWLFALGYILNQAPHNKDFFWVWICKLKWCWIFWMNFHNASPNVLWKHLENFEMNIMNMQYSKAHLNMCYFHYLMIYHSLFSPLLFVTYNCNNQFIFIDLISIKMQAIFCQIFIEFKEL